MWDPINVNSGMVMVTLQPNSNSNPSSKYRVVRISHLMRYMNGNARTYHYEAFEDFASAEAFKNTENEKRTLRS